MSHLLSACHPLVLFPHLSQNTTLLFPLISFHLPLLPPLWIVVVRRRQRSLGECTDNTVPASYTNSTGLPGCQHTSSWKVYFACQTSTNTTILHNAAASYSGNMVVKLTVELRLYTPNPSTFRLKSTFQESMNNFNKRNKHT